MSIAVPLPVTYWDGFTKGVNFSLAGTGGSDCVNFIPDWQKWWETSLAVFISFSFIVFSYRKLAIRTHSTTYDKNEVSWVRQLLLVLLCLTYGCEIGYKLSTSTVIWLANPCHLITMAQVVLLAAPSRRWVTALFRIMMHSMHGAVVALLLPVTNTRLLPFEVMVYWVQHVLIVTIPFILLYQKGPYVVEELFDWSWAIMALGILYFIYWVPIQLLCIITEVNLNNMVCPAISDPFYGRGYRLWALLHCGICIMFFGKVYTYVSLKVISYMQPVVTPAANGVNGVNHASVKSKEYEQSELNVGKEQTTTKCSPCI